jgi:ABC-type branched-subunit amino acid transport system ATPase component
MGFELLFLQDVSKEFGGVKALSNCTFAVHSGELVGLLGSNGAGKTTLFNLITGFLTPDSGTITFRNTNLLSLPPDRITHLGITRTFQQLRLIRQLTVLENLLLAFPRQPGEHLPNLFLRPQLTAAKEKKHRDQAMNILQDIGLTTKHNSLTDDLSYGQQKLLSIGCCLATGADLLLLDEPIAGVSPAMIDQILPIIQALPQQGKSVLLIEHNMDVVMNLCDRLIFMDAGTIVCEGSPEAVRNDPRVIAAYL